MAGGGKDFLPKQFEQRPGSREVQKVFMESLEHPGWVE